jgi:serine/threonine protein kinase
MELYCTHPSCPKPVNSFPALDDLNTLRTVKQQYCMACGMPLILEGRYLATRLLGEGGFGAAFLGRDRLTPRMRLCALKQFKPAFMMTPDQLNMARDLFHREAEVLEQLGTDHPQIPNLFASFDIPAPNKQTGSDDRFFYLVQEFIEGENLEQELSHTGKMNEAVMLDVLNELLDILEYIHAHDVIHRDIKPSNIMRHTNGRLHLLDFGAIKNVAKPGSTIIYSQGFAPPEQFRGQQVFFSSDLYALAATCVTLITNEPHDRLFDAGHNCWHWEQYAQVTPRTAAVLNKMLQNAPLDRFQSVAETRAALHGEHAELDPQLPETVMPPVSPLPPTELETPVAEALPDFVTPITKRVGHLPLHQLPLVEYLGHSSFLGVESGAIAVILSRLALPFPLPAFVWLAATAALIYLQWQRMLTKVGMMAIGISSLVVALIVSLTTANFEFLAFLATLIGGFVATIAAAILFRLVYRLLYRLT